MAVATGFIATANETFDQSVNTQQSAQVTAQGDTYGSMNSVSSGSSVGTIYATDLGAIQAGQSIASQGISASAQSVKGALELAGVSLDAAGAAIKSKAESDITKFIMPLVIGAVLIVAFFNLDKIKGAFK